MEIDYTNINEFGNYTKSVFDKLAEMNEDRTIVLTATLFIENALDKYLSAIIPHYGIVRESMNFSLKIKLAEAMCLSPTFHFDSAHLVRMIRNHFTHNLEVETFSDLERIFHKKKYKDEMTKHVHNFTWNRLSVTNEDFSAVFRVLASNLILNLLIFEKHNAAVNKYIRAEGFIEEIRNSQQLSRTQKASD